MSTVNDPVRIEYWYTISGSSGLMMKTGLMPRGRAEQTAKNLPQSKIIEIDPDKEYAYNFCKELNSVIEDYSYRTMMYGTGPQEVYMCITESLREFADLAGKVEHHDKEKNLNIMAEVIGAVTGNFDINWMTASAADRKQIIEKIITELKEIEVVE